MEALAAASLAGTIAQLVDFGSKLTSASVQIYRSADGTAVNESELRNVAKDMEILLRKVDEQLEERKVGTTGLKKELSEDEAVENTLALECVSVIKELETALSKVLKSGKTSKWRSFRQALLSVWHREHIDGIERRLCRFREQLTIRH
jgi:hypothetical protein